MPTLQLCPTPGTWLSVRWVSTEVSKTGWTLTENRTCDRFSLLCTFTTLEQNEKERAGIKAAAGSDAVLTAARGMAESSASDLEALLCVANNEMPERVFVASCTLCVVGSTLISASLIFTPHSKQQAKLTGMPPTNGQLESMGLLGYIVGGANGLSLINVWKLWMRSFPSDVLSFKATPSSMDKINAVFLLLPRVPQRVLKECIDREVPLAETLLVIGHDTAK